MARTLASSRTWIPVPPGMGSCSKKTSMKITSLRNRILLITCFTVIGALVLSGVAIYHIVRDNMMATISADLDAPEVVCDSELLSTYAYRQKSL